MVVKTRFAPSPTGFLHVGGVRTALYSWLFAKHHQGEFVLRIEDTDQERSTDESVQVILEGMDWLGLASDSGPFYQTQRYERYLHIADKLLTESKAYRCSCSKERLEALREAQMLAKEKPRYDGKCRDLNLAPLDEPHVLRFKNPLQGKVAFTDAVYGTIEVDNAELDDLILVRSDGNPTYNFAVVVDDMDMEITHVIRGDDHINNTPRQINLFEALNAPIPIFAHLPMILGDDGKRLSKRHGAVSVLDFKNQGILPEALLNYLVRLGWSHGDQEIFSLPEMIGHFDLTHISRGVSSFSYDKLHWLNQHYLKEEPPEKVAAQLQWHLDEKGISTEQGPKLSAVVEALAERCKTLAEMADKCGYFYQDTIRYDEDAIKKHLRPVILSPLTRLYEALQSLTNWSRETIHQTIIDVSCECDIAMGKIGQPLRVAVTGTSMSPSIDCTLALIGKTRTLHRLQQSLEIIKNRMSHN